MATSLARQLGQVRQNALETVDKNKAKQQQSASVLFDKKDAIKTDLETVYDIAIDGLESLIELDPKFSKFKTTLFSETSKQVDRTLQTGEENKALNSAIEAFLALLAPRMQLQCSLQSLEWLIRRFRVHELNASILLLTILPYYSHPHFPVILSVIKLSKGFEFLKSCQDHYSTATRHTIVQGFVRNLSLWTLFSNYVSKVVTIGASYHALIAFWASISVETIVKSKEDQKSTDAIIIEMGLPIVSNGLPMLKSPDFQIANYMVLSALVSCCTVSNRAFRASLETIGKYLTGSTYSAGLACAAQLCQVRQVLLALPKTLYDTLQREEDIVAKLIELSEAIRADKLVTCFCLNVIKFDKEKLSILIELLQHPTLSDNEVLEVMKELLIVLYSEVNEKKEQFRGLLAEIAVCDRLLDLLIQEIDREGKDIEILEMSYQLSLKPQKKHKQQLEDVENIVVTNGHHISSKELIRSIPADIQVTTFLCDDERAPFATIIGVFLQIHTDSQAIDDFFSLEVFQHGDFSRVTLLIKVWTGQYPEAAKLAALRLFKEKFLESMLSFDTQAIIPHLLVAMSDESTLIRTKALEIVAVLNTALSLLSKQADVWAMDELYGPSNSVKLVWISSKETKRFLAETLLPKHAEIEMDAEVAAISLRQILPINVRGKELIFRNSLIDFLTSHALQSPVINIKKRLLDIFTTADAEAFAAKNRLVPLLVWWYNIVVTQESLVLAENFPVIDFEKRIIQLIGTNGLKELLDVLQGDHARLCLLVTGRLIDIWHRFSDTQRVEISGIYCSMLASEKVSQQKVANEFFDAIQLSSSILRALLPQDEVSITAKPKKRMKAEEVVLLRTINALEILERNSPENHLDLSSTLYAAFNTHLSRFLNPATRGTYCEELFISCLLRMLNSDVSKIRIQASETRIDLLVNLLRSTNSPQLQQKTLLLIAAIAKLFPDQVLHGTMSVFTFMGANVLRQDSHSSARVIEEAIQKIVPQLIKIQPSPRKQLLTTGELVRNFTAAIGHIPDHRRRNLFVSLAKVLGVEKSLHLVLLLLIEKEYESQSDEVPSDVILPLGSWLLTSFDNTAILAVIRNYIDFVRNELPLNDMELEKNTKEKFFGVPLGESEQLVKCLFSSMATMMRKASFSAKEEESITTSTMTAVKDLLGSLLEALTHFEDQTAIEESLLHIFNEFVLGTTIQSFASIVSELIHHPDPSLRQKLFEVLKLRSSMEEPQSRALCDFARRVMPDIVHSINFDDPVSSQLALDAIGSICANCSSEEADIFLATIDIILDAFKQSNKDLVVTAVVAISRVVPLLGIRIVPRLPILISQALELRFDSDRKNDYEVNGLLAAATVNLFAVLFESIPAFMPTYAADILLYVVNVSQTTEAFKASQIKIQETYTSCLRSKSAMLSAVDAINRCMDSKVLSSAYVLSILEKVLSNSNRVDITNCLESIIPALLRVFDEQPACSTQCISSLMQMVLKLNDTTFRPIFGRIYEWASDNDALDELRMRRLAAFFSFFRQLLTKLRSIITQYYAMVLETSIEILKASEAVDELCESVLETLRLSFKNDAEDFWQLETRFSPVANLLLDLLERPSFSVSEVSGALVDLATVAPSEGHFKLINDQLLQMMRSDNVAAQIAALKSQYGFYTSMGDEWIAFLPQSVPVIGELLETHDEHVENETKALVKAIESILGESMDKYLS